MFHCRAGEMKGELVRSVSLSGEGNGVVVFDTILSTIRPHGECFSTIELISSGDRIGVLKVHHLQLRVLTL